MATLVICLRDWQLNYLHYGQTKQWLLNAIDKVSKKNDKFSSGSMSGRCAEWHFWPDGRLLSKRWLPRDHLEHGNVEKSSRGSWVPIIQHNWIIFTNLLSNWCNFLRSFIIEKVVELKVANSLLRGIITLILVSLFTAWFWCTFLVLWDRWHLIAQQLRRAQLFLCLSRCATPAGRQKKEVMMI